MFNLEWFVSLVKEEGERENCCSQSEEHADTLSSNPHEEGPYDI